MGLWAAWGFAISHFAVEFIFAWYSSGFVFFSGDCLNCMVFGLLHRMLCNMCLVVAERAGVEL